MLRAKVGEKLIWQLFTCLLNSSVRRVAVTKMKWHYARLPSGDPARFNQSPHCAEIEAVRLTDAEVTALRLKNAERSKKKFVPSSGPRRMLNEVLSERREATVASLGKRIAVVRVSGKTDSNHFIQETALQALAHALRHGDTSAALNLVMAMPKGPRRAKLIDWFARHSPIRINEGTGSVGLLKRESRRYRPFDIDGARLNQFYERMSALDD